VKDEEPKESNEEEIASPDAVMVKQPTQASSDPFKAPEE
jgi:hypothetical protein